MKREYKYMRGDFGQLPLKLNHITIRLNFVDDRVEAENCLAMTAKKQLDKITLDADELKIIEVAWLDNEADKKGKALKYDYDKEKKKLVIFLPQALHEDEDFFIRTRTHCFPSDTVLEGIYKDITPEGAPQQYVSQCEQWGFQRIMPIIDDCRAKCTMTTTIEADAAYTHMISNGNISNVENPDGKPKLKPDDPSRKVITYENNIPMAPYLFCVLVGTWDMLEDVVTYDNQRKVRLEYLVPKGRTENAKIPMEILKKSILWIKETQDYEYTRDTYRTITMDRANIGGMENVGNTTIVTDSALVDEHTLDRGLLYAYAVIVHEFEHNQCGSEVTMETPFDMWLNEGYTVDVERQFSEDQFNPTVIRLNQVDSIRDPLLGPLAVEDAGVAGRIQRTGFNHPDELVDGVTYVKAAEVIRMLRLILGKDKFTQGKSLYFSRYHNSNANTDDFFRCFEEVSGQDLARFKKGWILSKGYPKVTAETKYDEVKKQYIIRFVQEPGKENDPFHIPIELALVSRDGRDMPGTAKVFDFKENEAKLVIENVGEKPAFASINRGYSFYGTFKQLNISTEVLLMQARKDPDKFNMVEAMRQLTDIERIRLLNDPDAEISSSWLELFAEILGDDSIEDSLKARLLSISETPLDRKYSTWYPELVVAKEKLMKAVNKTARKELVRLFFSLDTYSDAGSLEEGIEKRMLKAVLLSLIAIDDTPESHKIIIEHYRKATTANDRVTALAALNRSSSPERKKILEEVYNKWHSQLNGYANYLRVVSSGTHQNAFEEIEQEKQRKGFDIKLPTHARALIFPMAFNTKMVWTDKGMQWIRDTVIEFSPINTTLASRLLNTFQHVQMLKPGLKKKVTAHLMTILDKATDNPVISEQAKAYLR